MQMALSDRGRWGFMSPTNRCVPLGHAMQGGVGGGSLCAVFFLPSDSRGPPSHNVPQSRSSTGSTGMPAAYTTGPRRSASPSGLLPLHRFPLGLHSMAWHRCHAVTPTASPTTFRLFAYSRSTVRSTAFAEPMQTHGRAHANRAAAEARVADPSTQARHIGGLGRPRSSTHASARPQPAANRIEWQLRPKRDPPAARALVAAAARAAAAGRPR